MSRLLLSLALGLACGEPVLAQGERDAEKQGGHPLAARSGNLESLLFEKDWPVDNETPTVPRPAVDQMPIVQQPTANIEDQMRVVIEDRNDIVDNGKNLLAALRELNIEEQNMAVLVRQQGQAQGNLTAAKVALNQAMAMGAAAPPGAVGNARNQVERAAQTLQRVIGQCARQVQKMQPLHDRVDPAIGPWFACYGKMRALVGHDRQDPNRRILLPILEAECTRREDFCEGRVLAAIGCVYDGRPDAARDHLEVACRAFGPCDLFKSVFANDCCHGYLLLGLPEAIQEWTKWVKNIDAKRQTTARCWLVGQMAMLQFKENDAAQWFGKSISKSGMLAKQNPAPASPVLVGDAAGFYLTCANEKVRNPDKARDLIAKVPPDTNCWQMLRARAALAAEDADWDRAVQLIASCGDRCPPTIQEEVAAQRKNYESKQPWLRTRPEAP